jgi:Flp pilus assembly protein TadD
LHQFGQALLDRLQVTPMEAVSWNDLGAVLERLGDDRQAATAYRRSATAGPDLGTGRLLDPGL